MRMYEGLFGDGDDTPPNTPPRTPPHKKDPPEERKKPKPKIEYLP